MEKENQAMVPAGLNIKKEEDLPKPSVEYSDDY